MHAIDDKSLNLTLYYIPQNSILSENVLIHIIPQQISSLCSSIFCESTTTLSLSFEVLFMTPRE